MKCRPKMKEMMMYMTLVPAYGRDYKSGKEVKAAWEEGKDFRIASFGPDDGKYVNKNDAPRGATLKIRFKRLQNICVIKVK
jgi:hypothetical protein